MENYNGQVYSMVDSACYFLAISFAGAVSLSNCLANTTTLPHGRNSRRFLLEVVQSSYDASRQGPQRIKNQLDLTP
jgi:hypothetical protein